MENHLWQLSQLPALTMKERQHHLTLENPSKRIIGTKFPYLLCKMIFSIQCILKKEKNLVS